MLTITPFTRFTAAPAFQAKKKTVAQKPECSCLMDHFESGHEKNIPRYLELSKKYQSALEYVAKELEDEGFIFDKKYNSISPVKSAKSIISKVQRGTIESNDTIRATVYNSDLYDISNLDKLDKFITLMEKYGYKLAPIPKKPGKFDLDIRLSPEVNAGSYFQESHYFNDHMGFPQKSGYEDIQIRFVSTAAPKKEKYELIILLSPEYANAKHLESEKVYGHVRRFDELNIKKDEQPTDYSKKADQSIKFITKKFRENVAQKLFLKAKLADYCSVPERRKKMEDILAQQYNINLDELINDLDIKFTTLDVNLIDEELTNLKKLADIHFRIKDFNKEGYDRIELAQQDKALISEIRKGLRETISYFNSQK